MKQIGKELENQGYKLIQQGQDINGEWFRFIHQETFKTICINEESLDDEELWDNLGTSEGEIIEAIQKKGKTSEEAKTIIDKERKEYDEVIKEIIKENQEVLKK